ncbi:MAG: CDP-glycerol glycerophosphotransferase family protein [Ruminococcus sp.]|nr:CDP-glycerol glycerophosphotransferase family protein [Ruminococcus sp.]
MPVRKSAVKQYIKTLLQSTLLPLCYDSARRRPLNKKLILFADSNSDSLPESMESLKAELAARGFECEEQCCDLSKAGMIGGLVYMCRFMRRYAEAGGVVVCNFFVPLHACKKRRGTRTVQVWHSCGAFKKFGYSTPSDVSPHFKGSVSRNFDIVTVSSPECIPAFEEAFRLKIGVARALGVPRTDVFFDRGYAERCREKLYSCCPGLRGKRLILYLPTFRGDASRAYSVGVAEIEALRDKLPDDCVIAVREHPRVKGGKVELEKLTTNELLICADMLISDYSSAVFEFALLMRPMLLWCPDLGEYLSERDFYLDIQKDMPCPVVTDRTELGQMILRELKAPDLTRYRAFNDKYMSACDGNATKRTADLFNRKDLQHNG